MNLAKYDDLAFTASPNLDPQTQACIRMWAAVFRAGLLDAADNFKLGYRNSWFESDDQYPGSFVWLCDLFNLDPDKARSMVRMKYRALIRSGDSHDAQAAHEVRTEMDEVAPTDPVEASGSHKPVRINVRRGSKNRQARGTGEVDGGACSW